MSSLGEQIDDLARVRYTTSEVSLEALVDAMSKHPERYIVKRSRNQPNNWLVRQCFLCSSLRELT